MIRFIIAIILIIVGGWIYNNYEWLLRNIGPLAWVEKKLNLPGGTTFFYKLLGSILIVLGFIFIFSLLFF